MSLSPVGRLQMQPTPLHQLVNQFEVTANQVALFHTGVDPVLRQADHHLGEDDSSTLMDRLRAVWDWTQTGGADLAYRLVLVAFANEAFQLNIDPSWPVSNKHIEAIITLRLDTLNTNQLVTLMRTASFGNMTSAQHAKIANAYLSTLTMEISGSLPWSDDRRITVRADDDAITALLQLLLQDPDAALQVLAGPHGATVVQNLGADTDWLHTHLQGNNDAMVAALLQTVLLDHALQDPDDALQAYGIVVNVLANQSIQDMGPRSLDTMANIVVRYMPYMIGADLPADLRAELPPGVLPVAPEHLTELIGVLHQNESSRNILLAGTQAHSMTILSWVAAQDDPAASAAVAGNTIGKLYDFSFAGANWTEDEESTSFLKALLLLGTTKIVEWPLKEGSKLSPWLLGAATLHELILSRKAEAPPEEDKAVAIYVDLTNATGSTAGPNTTVPAVSMVEVMVAQTLLQSWSGQAVRPMPPAFLNTSDPVRAATAYHQWKSTWPDDFRQQVATITFAVEQEVESSAENLGKPPAPPVSGDYPRSVVSRSSGVSRRITRRASPSFTNTTAGRSTLL